MADAITREIEIEVCDLAAGEVVYGAVKPALWDRAKAQAEARGIETPRIVAEALEAWTEAS